MQFRKLAFIALLLFTFSFLTYGEVPKVRFYPQKELTFCKGCFGSFGEDGWEFKFKLENLSGKDLFVYGHQFDKDDGFKFTYQIQYKNPDICEWQYSYGSSDKRGGWKGLSSFFKSKIVLKAGESIETPGGAFENNKIPERYTAYIAENPDEEPYEIFSEPYLLVKSADEKNGINNIPILKIVDEECMPNCQLSIEQTPEVRGIKLGMPLSEFKKKFPKAEVSEFQAGKYHYQTAWVSDWNEDAYDTKVYFYDDRVVQIRVQFKSLKNTRERTDFYKLVSEKLQMPYFWEPYQSKWECRDFLIDVLPNETPTITVRNKSFIKIQKLIVEEDQKKYK